MPKFETRRPRRAGRPVPFVAVLAVVALALLPLPACQKVDPSTAKNIPSGLPDIIPGAVSFDGGAQVRVQVLKSAKDREIAPGRTAFEVLDGVAHGLLHAYPADTTVVFRQGSCPIDTEVAFVNGEGKVVEVAPVPATPRKLTGMDVPPEYRNNPQFDPEIWLAFESDMTGAFAIEPLQDVRWAVQVPIGWCAKNNIKPGTGCKIPDDVAEKAKDPEPVFPQIEFSYTPWNGIGRAERGGSRIKRFSLRTAFTPDSRRRYLSADVINQLGVNDAVLVAWPDERVISLQTRDLAAPIYIVPVRQNATTGVIDSARGQLIELRPAERNATIEPKMTQEWEGNEYARNWEYRSKDKFHGFLMLSSRAIYPLRLEPSGSVVGGFKDDFSAEMPASVQRLPVLHDPSSVAITLTPEGEAATTARVRLLATDQDRYRGLANVGPLPVAGSGNTDGGNGNGGESAPAPVFNPELEQPDPAPEAWLIMFDRHRRRPLFDAALQGKHDVIVFDRDNRLSRVVPIDKPEDLGWPAFTPEQYRYLIVSPRGWLRHRSLTVAGTDTPLPKIRLDLPSEVTRLQPEPERYEIRVGGRTAMVEVAFEPLRRNRGLMWRRHLEPDTGMLFVYPDAQMRAFWMMNCFIDLDIAYLRNDWTIIRTLKMDHPLLPGDVQPEDGKKRPVTQQELSEEARELHGSREEARFALEMPVGWFRAQGISEGAKIEPGPVVEQFLLMTNE